MLWHQKSRELWLKEGDKSTKFFHLSTIVRRRRNNIDAIRSEEEEWITDKGLIRHHFLDNFRHLFTAEEVNFPNHLEDLVSTVISKEDNSALCTIPNLEEIKSTLFHMPELKAPGPDGFPVAFYKNFWPIVGNDVITAVTSFVTGGSMPKEINSSLIVLIPKVPNPSSFNHFRPISLCNVIYKIISKILVARIRPLLPRFISPCQSAFIPGRWIAENQVIVQELIHSFKVRKIKAGQMAIKIVLQKAYDRVNWDFLQVVLNKLGFNGVFIGWILACVSSVSFEVLVNGGKSDQFKPSRGLRQGDPLSAYLFIIGQEVLSRMLEKEFTLKNIDGVKASASAPPITHVMYADDIILFSKATRNNAEAIVKCIQKYCEWSGQSLNNAKSGVFFSKQATHQNRKAVKHILQMKKLKKKCYLLRLPPLLVKGPHKRLQIYH